jgi:hypothetical protein
MIFPEDSFLSFYKEIIKIYHRDTETQRKTDRTPDTRAPVKKTGDW